MAAAHRAWGAMCTCFRLLWRIILVNALFLGDPQVVGNWHDDDPGMEGFVFLVADERLVLRFVGVGDDQLIGGDEGETAGLEVALLGEGEQIPQKLLVALQHFLKLHDSPVGDVQFAVKAVGPGVRLGAVLGDRGKVDAARQFRDVLGFGIGGLKVPMPTRRSSENRIRSTGTRPTPPFPFGIQPEAADRAQGSFDRVFHTLRQNSARKLCGIR